MKVDTWIASTNQDYPGLAGPDDSALPIANVWHRVAYGAAYIGDDEVRRLSTIYESQGINFYAVMVPTRAALQAQLSIARKVLGMIRGLQVDMEPYSGYLDGPAGMQQFLDVVLRPLAGDGWQEISMCYDPREQHLSGWDFPAAVNLVQSLAPMVYTGMFAGQSEWGDPVLAIHRAKAQAGTKLFRPIIQAYEIAPEDTMRSFDTAVEVGGHPQLFRRGLVAPEIWQAITERGEPMTTPTETDKTQSEQIANLQTRMDALEAKVAALESRIRRGGLTIAGEANGK